MQSLKRELSQEREAVEDRLVKRMRMEKGPTCTFKKTSHKKQFQFNANVAKTDYSALVESRLTNCLLYQCYCIVLLFSCLNPKT